MQKWCWVRGSGRGGSRAGMDASGRGGTARDGLPSKGPATALVGSTSGRQPLVWAPVETCHTCLWGPVPGRGRSAPAPPASLPCRDADLQDQGLGPTCPLRPSMQPHAEGEVPPPTLSSPGRSVGPLGLLPERCCQQQGEQSPPDSAAKSRGCSLTGPVGRRLSGSGSLRAVGRVSAGLGAAAAPDPETSRGGGSGLRRGPRTGGLLPRRSRSPSCPAPSPPGTWPCPLGGWGSASPCSASPCGLGRRGEVGRRGLLPGTPSVRGQTLTVDLPSSSSLPSPHVLTSGPLPPPVLPEGPGVGPGLEPTTACSRASPGLTLPPPQLAE